MEIYKKTNWFWIYGAVLATALSFVLGVWRGPAWIFMVSGTGLLLCVINGVCTKLKRDGYPPLSTTVAIGLIHVLFIIVGFILFRLFISPLNSHTQQIPTLGTPYYSPDRKFSLVGPMGWTYVPQPEKSSFHLMIKPQSSDQYMGASEIRVQIRKLDASLKSEEKILNGVANMFSPAERSPQSKLAYSFRTEPAQLLSGRKGLWAVLDVQKLWIHFQQTTLVGIKTNRFLVSISVTGLKPHATLNRILCLGLFETVKIKE